MSEFFFLLWATTRLRENGWPARKGLIRRRLVVEERALAGALAEAVQIAIPIGASITDFALGIASSEFLDSDPPLTKARVDAWVDDASRRGDEKIQALPDVYPVWRRFVSITAVPTTAESPEMHGLTYMWDPEPDTMFEWNSSEVHRALMQIVAGAGIAMGWAVRYPDLAREALTPADDDLDWALETLGFTREQYLNWEASPFEFSLSLARTLVEKYEQEMGHLPRYEDLP